MGNYRGKYLVFSPEMKCQYLAMLPPCFYSFIGKFVGRILMATLSPFACPGFAGLVVGR